MREKEFNNEMNYQMTMHIARRMLSDGLISETDYHEIETIFLEKYQPEFGTLHAKLPLT